MCHVLLCTGARTVDNWVSGVPNSLSLQTCEFGLVGEIAREVEYEQTTDLFFSSSGTAGVSVQSSRSLMK